MDCTLTTLSVGQRVRAFDPRTLGVIKHGTITAIGRKYVTVDFGLSGSVKLLGRDILLAWKPLSQNS
jgi:hypothetical protein